MSPPSFSQSCYIMFMIPCSDYCYYYQLDVLFQNYGRNVIGWFYIAVCYYVLYTLYLFEKKVIVFDVRIYNNYSV